MLKAIFESLLVMLELNRMNLFWLYSSRILNLCIQCFYLIQPIQNLGWSYLFGKIVKMPLKTDDFFFCVIYSYSRLTKVINILSNSQPPCPQLYLYSTADKVIPVRSVEFFIQKQNNSGRKTRAYNFGLSPHVDHYRSFPHIYSRELHKFLKECTSDCFSHLPHKPENCTYGESSL